MIPFGLIAKNTIQPISLAATASYTDASGGTLTTHALNLPSGIVAGDLLLLFVAVANGATVTDPSGWTTILSLSSPGLDVYRVYAKIASGSEGSTLNYTLSVAKRLSAASYRITGNRSTIDTSGTSTATIAVSSGVQDNVTTPNPPSLTPAWGSAENLWIALSFSEDTNQTLTSWPANYSLGQVFANTAGNNASSGLAVCARILTQTVEDPPAFTMSTAKNRNTYTLAIRPQ